MGGGGHADGVGAAAGFNLPIGVATDSAGNVYVADTSNHTIRKITPAGLVSTLAGTPGVRGGADATGAAASFDAPQGIATDSAGNVYVADQGTTIRKITPAGAVSTFAGMAGAAGSTDATGAAARFNFPIGVATDAAGNVYVADSGNFTVRKITPAGAVTTLAGTAPGLHGGGGGSVDGTGAAAYFGRPTGVATDSAGNVYVADEGGPTIRKITAAGVVTTIAGTVGVRGSTDATGTAAQFHDPKGVATDSAGNVYVGDTYNNTIRKITPAGAVTTLAGTAGAAGSTDATGAAARFGAPIGVAADSAGNVFVADTGNNTIRKITPAGLVTTLAGSVFVAGLGGSTDATGAAASFNGPAAAATDSAGNVYVADHGNSTIRKITPAGVVTTFAGTAGRVGSTDATGPAATFFLPRGVATDSADNVYVSDFLTHIIRKITPAGVVTTLAGTAHAPGSADGTGAAARFAFPTGLATDGAANVYVADSENNAIRKITPAGVVTTLAGAPGSSGGGTDGIGSAASFCGPAGVATDSAGNVYVADTCNSTIRKVTPAGVVTTLAGSAGVTGSIDATGPAARFRFPTALATDSTGNVYVADSGNSTIRKITPDGAVSTVVGVAGQAGFAAGPLPGSLNNPSGVAVNGTSLYITQLNGVVVVHNRP